MKNPLPGRSGRGTVGVAAPLPLLLLFLSILNPAGVQAQTPQITQTVPAESFLGEQFCFQTNFTNLGPPGFGPYIRLELPPGLIFDSASIFGIGGGVTNAGVFPAAPGNQLTDPKINQPVTGTPGNSLWILMFPVGSVVQGGPDLPIDICLTIDPSATVGAPLPVIMTPVYQFGDTATGDNGPLVGSVVNQSVTPTVLVFDKTDNAPESERPPGMTWPYSYTLSVDIANTAMINPLVIRDTLPPAFQFNGTANVTGGAGCALTQTPSTVTPGGVIEVTCTGNTVGTASAADVRLTYSGYLTDILDETFCDIQPQINDASAQGTYVPPVGSPQVLPLAADSTTVSAEHVVVQKGVAPGLTAPGAALVYTLNFQVTDFGDVQNLVVTDTMPDGIDFVSHGNLVVAGIPLAIAPAVTVNPDFTKTIVYDIGAVAGTVNAGSAIALSYNAQVRQDFQATNLPVLSSDSLPNTVVMDYDLAQGAGACSDGSGALVNIIPVSLNKQIVNLQPFYVPGEQVQFRLTMDVPPGDTRSIRFEDFLPLPVFKVTDLNLTFGGPDIVRGPNDTAGLTPTAITISVAQNALFIDWPDLSSTTGQTIEVDVFATVTDDPFADGLFLTNILLGSTNNTPGATAIATGPVSLNVGAPDMVITKGVSATDGNGAIAPPPATLPVNGDITDVDAGDQITYLITAENIGSAQAFDVTITDPGAAELAGCTVASVTDGAGAPLAFSGTLATGLQLTNPLAANDGTPGAPFGADTALVTVNCTVAGTIAPNTTFTNIATLLWTSQPGAVMFPPQSDGATATSRQVGTQKLFVATSEPGTSDTASPPRATIGEIVRYRLALRVPEGQIASLALRDNLPSGLTFLDDGSAAAAFVSNGVGLSSSTLPLILNIPGNDSSLASIPSTLVSFPLAGAIGGAPFGNGTDPVFNFGDVSNADSDGDDEFLLVEFNALVNNLSAGSNDTGDNRSNTFIAQSSGVTIGSTSNGVSVRIAEPLVAVTKSAMPNSGDAGDPINFTITATAASGADRSPAHEVSLIDTLPPGLAGLAGLNIAPNGACTGLVTTNNSAGDTIDLDFSVMQPGCIITITFSATLTTAVAPGTMVTNTAAAAWSSLPGANGTVINPTGSATPGASGAGDGERDGSGGINDYTAAGAAAVTIDTVVLSKAVTATSETATGNAEFRAGIDDLAIGESATFRITATIPEGTTPQVVITDTLPFTNGVMRLDSATVIAVGANLTPAIPAPLPAISDTQLGDGIDDMASFDFGQVTNIPDGIVDANDRIVVEVTATLVDVPANANGDPLTNSALVQFGAGLNASAGAAVDVVEPILVIDKAGSINQGDAGDAVTFTVSITHTAASSADAHDLVFTDPLPAGLALNPASIQVISGPNFDANTSAGNTVALGWAALAQTGTIVLQYQATLTNGVMPGETIINTGTIDWTSIAGANADERNNTANEGHQILVTDPGLVKTVFVTSEASTGSGEFGAPDDLTIGEQVTYRFVTAFPEGTTDAAVVTDQLPTGSSVLQVISSQVVRTGANLSGATLPTAGTAGSASDSDADTFDDRVTWNLGNVFNNPDGIADAADEIEFEVVAVVLDQPANQSGDVNQLNVATLTTATSSVSGNAPVDLVAPELNLAKTTLTPPGGFVDAGDTVRNRLVIAHTAASTADAFNLVLTDTLPAALNWAGDGTVSSDCPGLSIDSSGAPVIVFAIAVLDQATATCFIEYDTQVDIAAMPGETLTNSALLDYDSQPVFTAGQTRRRMAADTAQVTVLAPSLVKLAIDSGQPDTGMAVANPALLDVTIGETVTYELTVVFPEGTTNNAVVTDLLPAGAGGVLEAIGAVVSAVGGQISTTLSGTPAFADNQLGDGLNDTVSFDFGTVTNQPDGVSDAGDRIVIQVVARVVDVPANTGGDLLTNNADFTFTGGMLSDSADIDVVEPATNLTKTMGPVTGGVVRLALGMTNSGTAPAYDIRVEDILDEADWNLTGFNPVSVPAGFRLTLLPNTPVPGQQTLVFDSDPLAVSPAGTIPAGANVTAVFDIPLAVLPSNPNPLPNQADQTAADTLPGGDPNARNLPPDSAVAQIGVPDLALSKSANLLNDADGSGTPSPGDTLRYTLLLNNSGAAAATGIVVADVPDANSALINGSVTSTLGTITIGNGPGDTTVQITIATLNAGQSVTIAYDTLIDDPLPAGVTQLVNQALIDSNELPPGVSDDPTPPGGGDPTVVPLDAAPDLNIVKNDGGVTVMPGDVIAYTLNYQNAGNQDATGVALTDTVPANSVFNPAASTAGWACAPGNNPGSVCTLTIGNLAAGSGGTAIFAVTVDNPLAAGVTQIANSAVIADDGSNGADPTPGDNSSSDTTPVNAAPDLNIAKDDGGVTTVPGGTVIWTLNFNNAGDQDATGVALTDTVPANSVFNPAASTAGWVCAPDNNPGSVCTLTIGNLAAGSGGGANFAVTVNNPLAAGVTQIANSAVIADDGSNGADPTLGDNSSADTTPVNAAPDLALAKDDGGITSVPGGVIVWMLNYNNFGDQNATGVIITDTVPADTVFNPGASTAGWSCVPNNNPGSACTIAIGNVAGGGAGGSVSFAVTVDDPLAAGVTQVANSAAVADDGTNGADTNPGNNTAGDTTPLDAVPDLNIAKDDGGISAMPGDVVAYTLVYQNAGDQNATGVVITESVPADTTFNPAASTAGWACAPDNNPGSVCTIAIGTVAGGGAGGSVVFAVTVDDPLAAGVTQIANSAAITDDGTNGADPTPGDNSAADTTPVNAVPDLNITKDDGGINSSPGLTIAYTLNYQNAGNQNATGVVISETVPADTTFDPAASTAGWVCTPGNNAGSACTFTVGTLAGGAGGSVVFAVIVDDPLAAGVTQIDNTANIADDGANGPDPTPGDNNAGDTTPLGGVPDLNITKDDGGIGAMPGDVVAYTLVYQNTGDQNATGVAIGEIVPANTTFVPGASTAGWSCAPDNNAGSACTLAIGNLAGQGGGGSAVFAVLIDDPLPAGVTQIDNLATIADDGANGADPTPGDNSTGDTTPIMLNPPAGLKLGEVTGQGEITWTMWWFNNANNGDLPVFIVDPLPPDTTFVTGSLLCLPDGASQCLNAVFNGSLNRIEVEAVLASDAGAAPGSFPDQLGNEIVIEFRTRVNRSGTFLNQADAFWDENNDGSPLDEQGGGQPPVMTDDPVTTAPGDPTAVSIAFAVPALDRYGLLALILLLAGLARREGRRRGISRSPLPPPPAR